MIRRLKRSPAGFTLVELMVAVTGGLFVAIAVFMLSRQATSFYQRESRAGNATTGAILGFRRLKTDIARAAYMSTANIQRDPKLCGDVTNAAAWPDWLERIAGVFIQTSSTTPQVLLDNLGRATDEIFIAGNFTTTDQFDAAAIVPVGGGAVRVDLSPDTGPLARLQYASIAAGQQVPFLSGFFPTGRALRIVDLETGAHQYGTITGVAGGPRPSINLSGNPPLQFRAGSGLKCGISGFGTGFLVNPVNIVHYSVTGGGAAGAGYAPLYVADGGPSSEFDGARRTDLVREELDTSGAAISGSQEVVAEYAVDMQFGITIASTVSVVAGSPAKDQLLTTEPAGSANIASWAGTPVGMPAGKGPEFVRAIRARLSVRSREADRQADVPTGVLPAGLYRIGLGTGGGPPFARVRTVQSDVALLNQMETTW